MKVSSKGFTGLRILPYQTLAVGLWFHESGFGFYRHKQTSNIILFLFIGVQQLEPPSPLISWVNPFPSRFMNRTACFPRKVSYFRDSRFSPWQNKVGWSRAQKPIIRPFFFFFLFTIGPFLRFYSRWELGIMKFKDSELPNWAWSMASFSLGIGR